MFTPTDRDDPPFDLRAEIDALEKAPRPARRIRVRELDPTLRLRWSRAMNHSDRERGLRAVAEDLFLLATVEFVESERIAREVGNDWAPHTAGTASSRTDRQSRACRDAFSAAVLLGVAQRALEETRCALLLRTPRDGLAPVTADGDPVLARFGALLVTARASALSMCEALRLVALSMNEDSRFADERAIAASGAAFHSARSALRATLLGSLELSSATNQVRETRLLDWVTDALHWSQMEPAGGPIESTAAREFLRIAR